MTTQERILESETRFNEKQSEREGHLKAAEECLTEMAKLQGEWRVLKQIEAEEQEAADPAKTVGAKPAKAKAA